MTHSTQDTNKTRGMTPGPWHVERENTSVATWANGGLPRWQVYAGGVLVATVIHEEDAAVIASLPARVAIAALSPVTVVEDIELRVRAWRTMAQQARSEGDAYTARIHEGKADTLAQLARDLREQPVGVRR